MALQPHHEGIVAIVPHEAYGCFFVSFSNSKKWFYAITMEPVYPGQKLGIVLDQNNELKALKASDIKKAIDRLKDTSRQAGKAFAQSPYVMQFIAEGVRPSLMGLYLAYRKDIDWDSMEGKFQMLKDDFTLQASRAKSRRDKQAVPSVGENNAVKPKPTISGHGQRKLKTPVATNMRIKEVSLRDEETVDESTDALGRKVVHWTLGTLTKCHGLSSTPYEITWDTQPCLERFLLHQKVLS